MTRDRRAFGMAIWASVLQTLLLTSSVARPEGTVHGATARQAARQRLAAVERWGCQYQNIDVAHLAATSLDLVVIEPVVDGATGGSATREEVTTLKLKPDGTRRLVLAYLSVGAAEEYRSYWQSDWKRSDRPDWLGHENPEWPRSYSVRYWQSGWRGIVADALIRLVETGYDGAFLDRVDAFHDWRDSRKSAQNDMTELIAELGGLARARNPAFLFVGQNAEQLLADKRYVDAIDAVSKESLLTGLRGDQIANTRDDIEWSLSHLLPAKDAGLSILTIEYLQDRSLIERAADEHKRYGFVPFFGTRMLDRLP